VVDEAGIAPIGAAACCKYRIAHYRLVLPWLPLLLLLIPVSHVAAVGCAPLLGWQACKEEARKHSSTLKLSGNTFMTTRGVLGACCTLKQQTVTGLRWTIADLAASLWSVRLPCYYSIELPLSLNDAVFGAAVVTDAEACWQDKFAVLFPSSRQYATSQMVRAIMCVCHCDVLVRTLSARIDTQAVLRRTTLAVITFATQRMSSNLHSKRLTHT
jgi:hypothetical protein